MFKKIIPLLFVSLTVFANEPAISLHEKSSGENEIIVNNRVIVKINGKPLTVVDVVKKMDLHFYRQYPHLVSSAMARYEFYMASFQYVFSALVNDLLVVADAEEKKIEVTDGDVREEMEKLFGPTVVANIDKLQLTYEEAWGILKRDLIVQKMTGMMVRSKAINEVQPKNLKSLYDEYLAHNPPEKEWCYQILTVKGDVKEKVEEVVARLHQDVVEKKEFPSKNTLFLKAEEGVELTLSEEYTRKEKDLSKAHQEVLKDLQPKSFSSPSVQLNRKDNIYVGRIFFLKDHNEGLPPTFLELESRLQHEVMERAVARHGMSYSEKLRQRYGITEEYLTKTIPPDFKPFALR